MSRSDAMLLVKAVEERGTPLKFVENRDGSVVHVVASASSDDTDALRLGGEEVSDEEKIRVIALISSGAIRTVCGQTIHCNRGGPEEGGRLTGWFDDDVLCRKCHQAFGEHSWLIFDGNPGEADADE